MNSDETLEPEKEYHVEEGEEESGFVTRLLSIFVAPGDVSRSLSRRPDWFKALLVVAIVAVVVGALLAEENAAFSREMMSQASKVELTEAQLDRMGEVTTRTYVTRAIGAVFWTGFQAILFALVLFLVGRGMGGRATFKTVFSVVSYSCLIGALGSLVSLIVAKLSGTFPVETSLAVLSGESYWSLSRVALGNLEIFWVWQLVFLTIGVGIAQGFSTGRAAVSTVTLFLLRGVILMGVTAIMHGFLGVA